MCTGRKKFSGPGQRFMRRFINSNVKLFFDRSFCREMFALSAYVFKNIPQVFINN
jgi:hypothetical protein